MLYFIYSIFDIQLFHYISVRAGLGFFISFCLSLFLMPKYITWARAKKANQPINKYVPAHENKQHTPTMGGAVFIVSTVIASFLTVQVTNIYAFGGLVTLVGFALVGIKDDLGKVLSGDNLSGLSAKAKMFWLIIVALLVSILLILWLNFQLHFIYHLLKTSYFLDIGSSFSNTFFWDS